MIAIYKTFLLRNISFRNCTYMHGDVQNYVVKYKICKNMLFKLSRKYLQITKLFVEIIFLPEKYTCLRTDM